MKLLQDKESIKNIETVKVKKENKFYNRKKVKEIKCEKKNKK